MSQQHIPFDSSEVKTNTANPNNSNEDDGNQPSGKPDLPAVQFLKPQSPPRTTAQNLVHALTHNLTHSSPTTD